MKQIFASVSIALCLLAFNVEKAVAAPAETDLSNKQQPTLSTKQLGLKGADRISVCLACGVTGRGREFVSINVENEDLASDTKSSIVDIWDMKEDKLVRSWHHPGVAIRVAISPDGTELLTAASGTTSPVRLWSMQTGKLLRSCPSPLADTTIPASIVKFHRNRRRGRHPDVWHVPQYYEYLPKNGFGATALAFSADGRYFAVGGEDGTIVLWDGKTGEMVKRFHSKAMRIWSIAFSPDGTRLLASARGCVQLWNVATGRMVEQYAGPSEFRWDYRVPIAFAPDGATFVFHALWRAELVICDARTGKERKALQRPLPGRSLSAVEIEPQIGLLPDGKTLIDATHHIFELRDIARGHVVKQHKTVNYLDFTLYVPEIAAILTVDVANDEMTLHETLTTAWFAPLSSFKSKER